MDVVDLTKHSIDVRCHAIKGMPRKPFTVHASLVDIAHMRIRIDQTKFLISRSSNAVFESTELLRRLRFEGL